MYWKIYYTTIYQFLKLKYTIIEQLIIKYINLICFYTYKFVIAT